MKNKPPEGLTFGTLWAAWEVHFTKLFLSIPKFGSQENGGWLVFLRVERQHFLQLAFTVELKRVNVALWLLITPWSGWKYIHSTHPPRRIDVLLKHAEVNAMSSIADLLFYYVFSLLKITGEKNVSASAFPAFASPPKTVVLDGYLVVTVDKLSELVRQNASAVLEWKLATGKGNLYFLLKVAGCSLQETNHQILCRWKMCSRKHLSLLPRITEWYLRTHP